VSDALLLFIAVLISYLLSKKTLEPLEVAYQKQKRFVADAAHELRTPLAVMKAGGEVIIQRERSVLEYQHFLAEFSEEVERLIKLSNDLLYLANSEGGIKSALTPISFSDITQKQSESILLYAKLKQVVVHLEIAEGISILGQKDDVTRLVLNLLKNAVDYNKVGGTITVTLAKKGNQALLQVKDTGIGIAAKNIAPIFDRFYKADSSRTQSASVGTGLGLSIVNDIVTRHSGTIRVSSVLGQGSVFQVEIPFI
jgi:signal transduction histidine kinase